MIFSLQKLPQTPYQNLTLKMEANMLKAISPRNITDKRCVCVRAYQKNNQGLYGTSYNYGKNI